MHLKHKNLYYVGGVVRDEILGVPSFDTDFCYEGNAIEFAKGINLEIVKENPDFGTVRVITDGKEIDIASTRCESYPKLAHLPLVGEIGCSLKEDLKRRDFTINALAKNTVTCEIMDYFNGLDDLRNKKIRVLHERSFIEDPSRIIRGLKFSVRFKFELEEHTKFLQEEYLKNVNYNQSYHRLKKELKETFSLNKKEAYEKFVSQGIYNLLGEKQVVIDFNPNEEIIAKYLSANAWLVYIGHFNLSNFELTVEEKNIVDGFMKVKDFISDDDYEIYKQFADKPIETVLLYTFAINEEIGLRYLEKLKDIKLELCGDDIQKLGIEQGVIYKQIFETVLREKIKTPNLSKQDEIAIVKEEFLC